MIGHVYIGDSFDTIFNMGYGGGAYNTLPPPPRIMGRENRPWTKGLNVLTLNQLYIHTDLD